MNRAVLGLPLVLAALASTSDAHALGPIDLEAGLKAGVATNPDSSAGKTPYGFGLGARGGVSIFNVYLGVSGIHYFGSSTDVGPASVSTSATLIGGELGYTFSQLPVIQIRPQIGIGNAHYGADVDQTITSPTAISVSGSSNHLYLEPGLTVLVPLGLLYVGADANALIVPGVDQGAGSSKTYTSLSVHGQLGLRF